MITELSNGHCAGIRWSAIGVEFWDQPHYGAPHSFFIRILLDCADNLLVVKTLAVKPGLRLAKLPDIRAFLATVSLHTSALHPILQRRRCGVEGSSGMEANSEARGGRNQSSELLCGGNAQDFRIANHHGMPCLVGNSLNQRFADYRPAPGAKRLASGESEYPAWAVGRRDGCTHDW
jgi:hypothetical protein